jgi:hypothetical protein
MAIDPATLSLALERARALCAKDALVLGLKWDEPEGIWSRGAGKGELWMASGWILPEAALDRLSDTLEARRTRPSAS